MGLDYMVKFKNEITYKGEVDKVFSPFTRGLSQFIGNHKNGAESLLMKVQGATGIELEFITQPNLYDFQVNDMQLEFADKAEKERLLKVQKEYDAQSHKAWYKIQDFINKLDATIKLLSKSKELIAIDYNRKWWRNYLEDGRFINDLELLSEVLASALKQNQEEFTYVIY